MPAQEELIMDNSLKNFIDDWKVKPGGLIMILHHVQQQFGYIPSDIIAEIAKILNISQAKIYGVATFYHFFKLEKPGKHVISVCTGTACYLKGAEELIGEIKRILDIELGQVSADGKFSLEGVRCLGCCGLAPVVMIDGKIFGRVEPKQIKDILKTVG
jgi:NADH-quinone oxidoreductase subunit E